MSNLPHVARVKKLYKLILRLHRSLPGELKELGDIYTRDEFRRHKKCTPHEANIFLDEWTVEASVQLCLCIALADDYDWTLASTLLTARDIGRSRLLRPSFVGEVSTQSILMSLLSEYFVKVSKQIKPTPQSPSQEVGLSLDPQFLDNMRDEQIMQLYVLRKAALKIEGSDEH